MVLGFLNRRRYARLLKEKAEREDAERRRLAELQVCVRACVCERAVDRQRMVHICLHGLSRVLHHIIFMQLSESATCPAGLCWSLLVSAVLAPDNSLFRPAVSIL